MWNKESLGSLGFASVDLLALPDYALLLNLSCWLIIGNQDVFGDNDVYKELVTTFKTRMGILLHCGISMQSKMLGLVIG